MTTETIPGSDARAVAAARRRERVLEAAAACFAEKGFKATTMDEVAWAADVSKPFIYKHFESKDTLADAVLDEAMTSWSERVEGAIASASSARARLEGALRASIAFAGERPILLAILRQDRRTLLAGHSVRFRRANADSLARTRGLLADGVAAGELAADLDLDATAAAVELVHFSLVEAVLGMRGEVDLPALVDATLRLLLGGLTGAHS